MHSSFLKSAHALYLSNISLIVMFGLSSTADSHTLMMKKWEKKIVSMLVHSRLNDWIEYGDDRVIADQFTITDFGRSLLDSPATEIGFLLQFLCF